MQRKNNMHIHFFQDVVTIFSCNIFKLPKTWLTPRLYHHDVILLKVSETHSHQQKFPFVDRSYSLLYLLYPPRPQPKKKKVHSLTQLVYISIFKVYPLKNFSVLRHTIVQNFGFSVSEYVYMSFVILDTCQEHLLLVNCYCSFPLMCGTC